MKVKSGQNCDRCWLSEKILGNYVCTKKPTEICPDHERQRLLAIKEAEKANERR